MPPSLAYIASYQIAYAAPPQATAPAVADGLKLDVRGLPLSAVCQRIALQLHRSIKVEPELRDRRVVALCSRLTSPESFANLVASLRFSLRETDAGYEIYRSEEQKKQEQNQDKSSLARYERAYQDGCQKLSEKLGEAITSPKLSLGTFLGGFTTEQRDAMVRLAQQPMGMLYAENHRNLTQRTLYLRPFTKLSPSDQTALKTLLDQSGYQFSDLQGPPDDLSHSSVGIVAAFGGLRLGIVGTGSKDIWYDPANAVSAPSSLSGQTADPADYNPVIAQERETEQLLRGMTAAWRVKTVRFNPLDKARYLPSILHDIEKQTGLAFFGPCYLHTEYPTLPLGAIKEGIDIPLADVLQNLCRAYGQRMDLHDGSIYLSSMTPGMDRRLEPSRTVMDLLTEKSAEINARKSEARNPTLTLENFTALCALTPAQLLILPRSIVGAEWVYTLSNHLQDNYLAANFYASLSEEERTQAMEEEGLEIAKLRPALRKAGTLLTEIGITAIKETMGKKPLTFSVEVKNRTLESSETVLQRVIFTFVSRDGFARKTEFSF